MRVLTTYKNGLLTLYFKGELDHHEARDATDGIERIIDEYLPRDCIMDMSGLTFMDSSGIALLLRTERLMRELDGSLTVIGLPEQPGRVLQASGMAKRLTILD